MPELPEVENVRLSLMQVPLIGTKFARLELRRLNLRTPLAQELTHCLPGQTIVAIRRRAKFLLFETEDYTLVNHLGMSGSWRVEDGESALRLHDHVVMEFQSGLRLVFNDPRRFGLLELVDKARIWQSKWLRHLGPEPLDPEFHPEFLFQGTRRLKTPVKNFIMDQKRVVGVGNIYASEALFAAGVKPTRPAGKITRKESERIVASVREILQKAIQAGGSTIRTYQNSRGESGRFQMMFLVYDRAGLKCTSCESKIRSRIIAGRNTFWCPRCQH
ncbi:MAG: bifunctional DNA-formamidopyrimidine glycosylase/DNA-(apurinic or apyrimidinic site) lyase [Bdellovibrionales bacterium]